MKIRVPFAQRRGVAVLAFGLSAVPAAFAQTASTTATLPETRITATRLPQDPTLLPMGVTVITREEIRAAGASDVNDAIRWLGGVVTRIDTSFTRNPTLDLRGFGETASSNLVVLVDGVRQNEGDMSGASINWIPVDSVERIEIVRGSGAVLHGEGATAGVINIVTSKGLAEPGGSASVGIGTQRTRQAGAQLRTAAGAWRHQLSAAALNSDGHRDNYALQDRSVLGRSTWDDGAVQLTAQLGLQRQQGGLPGGLNVQEFATNPSQTFKPFDHGEGRTAALLLGAEFPLGDWRAGLDLSRREVRNDAEYVTDGYVSASDTSAHRVGAKAWREMRGLGAQQRLLVGVDVERWSQDQMLDGGTWQSRVKIDQRSDALYARHEFDWKSEGLKAHAGLRRTLSQREATGDSQGTLDVPNTSWELGVAKRLGSDTQVYGRMGTSFRLANANEFSCSYGCPPSTLNLLKPQTSRDHEIGVSQRVAVGTWAARYYQSDLVNEIGLGADYFTNMNFDPTRRRGVEVEFSAKLAPDLGMAVQAAERRAEFREGVYAGKEVPLAPHRSLTGRLTYQMAPGRQWVLLTQWVSRQRVAGDLDNTCTQQIAGYGVVNLRYNHQMDKWTYSAQVNNLLDRSYYDYRSRCNPSSRSIYPEPGRSLLFVARRSL